ncbi:MAG: cation transporter [Burkholderiales bacterium]
MKRLAFTAVLLALTASASAQETKTATLYASKIYCEACAAVITKALRSVPGVSKVDVDVDKKEVLVRFDPAKASTEDLTTATAKKGFPSSLRKVEP